MLEHQDHSDDLMMELYRKLVPLPPEPEEPNPRALTYEDDGTPTAESQAIIEEYRETRTRFEALRAEHEEFATGSRKLREEIKDFIRTEVNDERYACKVLRATYKIVRGFEDQAYIDKYLRLVRRFLTKFSLRYELRDPFHLCPTLPGLFSTLLKELRRVAGEDDHLSEILADFDNALMDLNIEATPARIRSVISRQMNLIEAIGGQHPNANRHPNGNTLGAIAEDVGTWPHDELKNSLKKLYGFTNDYPGIRHGGTPANRIRDMDTRDVIAACVLIMGFTPYLTDQIDPSTVYTAA